MVRSAAAVLALLVFPALAPAQQQQEVRTHTVTRGTTLWGLAQSYYGDPYQWTRIFEANRDLVQDPDVLEPGLVLRIPEADAGTSTVRSVSVVASDQASPATSQTPPPADGEPRRAPTGAGSTPAEPPAAAGGEARQVPPRRRTVMYPEPVVRGAPVLEESPRLAFSRDDFYQAEWLLAPETEPERAGTVEGFMDQEGNRRTARPYDVLRLSFTDSPPAAGSRLQVFRVGHALESGEGVVVPTGILTVKEALDGETLAIVDGIYGEMTPGDLIRPLPPFPLTPGMESRPVADGLRAPVIGFAAVHQIQGIGDDVFIGAGSSAGVRPGDVFDVV
ncbi:MAG TPA: LysM peptidoglycan-binding domain-containing protein, partial [Longimicrobiales bacterium]|nr:LysM peptidoglycan-binding domain-containing protein [Longimicrobiales bacterium]